METPKPMQGMWTLTAPDGRTWQAESPLRCAATEQAERVPSHVALERIYAAADGDQPPGRGGFACPICGKDAPHHHTDEEVQRHRTRGLYRSDPEALDECLRMMFPDLDPDDLRTEGGNMNMPKVRTLWRERAEGQAGSDKLLCDVFLDLLGQVRAFIAEQGEADFWTGPAEALRWTIQGKTPPEHLQSALAQFLLKQGTAGVAPSSIDGGNSDGN